MDSNFDLNFPIQISESKILFDLNELPTTEENLTTGDEVFPLDNITIDSNEHHLDPEREDPSQNEANQQGIRRNLSNDERWEIFGALLERSVDGNLRKDVTREVSDLFSVPILTVQRIWRRAKETSLNGNVDVSHKKTGNCGRKKILLGLDQVASIPLHKRTTLRTFSMAMNVSLTTLFRRKKEGAIRSHTIGWLQDYVNLRRNRVRSYQMAEFVF